MKNFKTVLMMVVLSGSLSIVAASCSTNKNVAVKKHSKVYPCFSFNTENK